MATGANRFVGMARIVIWITPQHRKEWARAMLNELAYIESPRAAGRWMIGSLLFAVRERTIYELEEVLVNNKAFKTALVLVVVAVGAVAGTYAIQKPYQQERIKITLHRWLDGGRG
jgi:hypothetical protein